MSKSAPSSECSTNFYSIRHDLTQSDLYTIYIVESPHNLKLHVDSWSLMSKLVKATFSLHYHYTLIYENYSKNRTTNVDKIRINIITQFNWNVKSFSSTNYNKLIFQQRQFSTWLHSTYISIIFQSYFSTKIYSIFIRYFSIQNLDIIFRQEFLTPFFDLWNISQVECWQYFSTKNYTKLQFFSPKPYKFWQNSTKNYSIFRVNLCLLFNKQSQEFTVEMCRKILSMTEFFDNIFRQYFSPRNFDNIFRQHFLHQVEWCRIISKNAVELLFYSIFRYDSTKKLKIFRQRFLTRIFDSKFRQQLTAFDIFRQHSTKNFVECCRILS